MRLDQWITEKGYARSRTQAQELIRGGHVEVFLAGTWKAITKPGFAVLSEIEVRVDKPVEDFVSRAGDKLRHALEEVSLDVQGLTALDVGSSTGGFIDCLLKRGAKEVVGVDVGHGQLASQLGVDPRVHNYEGVNARSLQASDIGGPERLQSFDLIVMDVSFISMTLILPRLSQFLKAGGYLLSLIKPQFELGPDALDKRGIVQDARLYEALNKKINDACTDEGFDVMNYFESALTGREGNREFFIFARKSL